MEENKLVSILISKFNRNMIYYFIAIFIFSKKKKRQKINEFSIGGIEI